MIHTENQMATARVTTDALAYMLDLPQGIEITDVEVAVMDDDEKTLLLHLEGTHPVTGEALEDIEYDLQYRINEATHAPELVGIEPKEPVST